MKTDDPYAEAKTVLSRLDSTRLRTVFEEYAAAVEKAAKTMTPMPPKPKYMAHPAWPFGTVIGPLPSNEDFPARTRHMIVGLHPNREAYIALDLGATEPTFMSYLHLAENLHERWEPVPEPDD